MEGSFDVVSLYVIRSLLLLRCTMMDLSCSHGFGARSPWRFACALGICFFLVAGTKGLVQGPHLVRFGVLYPITGITRCILTLVASVLDSLLNQARFCSPSMPEAAEIACEAQQVALMHRAGAPGSFELLRGLWPCRADALDDGSCKHRVGAGQARSQRSEIGARNKASV